MSTEIDHKVVEMKFKNSDFEEGVKTSLGTLQKLKNALNFDGVADAFSEISASANKVSFDGISAGIDAASKAFNVFEQMAIGALRNLGASMEQFAVSTVKSLSGINAMQEGWGKYESKVESVQTIMSALPDLGIDEVSEQLERLLWFSDETSYSFTDMTSNIAKFTGAGVDLDVAVTAMQGAASWAASAGVNAKRATSAFYNISQAISAGSFKSQDWMSIEMLNMNTREFNQLAIETAYADGMLQKIGDTYMTLDGKFEVTASNIKNTLQSGWFSSGVILDVLSQYGEFADLVYENQEAGELVADTIDRLAEDGADALLGISKKAFLAAQQSKTLTDAIDATKDAVTTGWMNTYELIVGNYEQAVEVWGSFGEVLYNVFAVGGDVRNEILGIWNAMGGREKLLNGISKSYENLVSVFGEVNKAFRYLFPKKSFEKSAESLFALTSKFSDFAEKLKPSQKTLDTIRIVTLSLVRPFQILAIGIKDFKKAFTDVFSGGSGISGMLTTFRDKIFDTFRVVNVWIAIFTNALQATRAFYRVGYSMFSMIKAIGDLFGTVFRNITGFVNGFISIFAGDPFKGTDKDFYKMRDTVEKVVSAITSAFDWITEKILGFNEGIDQSGEVAYGWGQRIGNIFKGVKDKIEPIVQYIRDIIPKAFEKLKKLPSGVSISFDGLKGTLSKVKDSFLEFFDKVEAGFEKFKEKIHLKEVIENFKIFTGLVKEKLITPGLDKIQQTFTNLHATADGVTKVFEVIFGVFAAFAAAVGAVFYGIWYVIKSIATWIWDSVKDSLGGFENLSELFKNIGESIKNGDIEKTVSLIKELLAGGALASFILFMKELIDTIKNNPFTAATDGLKSFLEGFGKAMEGVGKQIGSEAYINIAKAILMITAAIVILALIPTDKLTQATMAIGIVFTEIASLFKILTTNFKQAAAVAGMGAVISALGLSILQIAAAILILSFIKEENLIKGVEALTIIMLTFGQFVRKGNSYSKNMLAAAAMFLAIGNALFTIAIAMKIMAAGDTDKNIVAFTMIEGLLVTMIFMTRYMKNSKVFSDTAEGIMGFAKAMTVFAIAIRIIAGGDLVNSLVAFGIIEGLMITMIFITKYIKNSKAFTETANAVIKLSEGILALALAISIVALAVNQTGLVNSLVAFAMIEILLASFVIMTKILKKDALSEGPFVAFGACIILIASAIKMLASIDDPVKLIGPTLAIVALMVAFGVMSKLMKGNKLQGAFMSFAAAILIIATAIKILSSIDPTIMLIATTAIGLLIITMAAVILLLSGAAPMLGAVSAVLLAFSGSLLLTGLAFISIAEGLGALVLFISTLSLLKPALQEGLQVFVDLVPEMVAAVSLFLYNIFVAIVNMVEETLPETLDKLYNIIVNSMEWILDVANYIFDWLDRAVVEWIPKLVQILGDFILQTLTGLNAWMMEHNDELATQIAELINNVAYLLIATVGELIGQNKEYIDIGWDMFKNILQGFGEAISGAWNDIKDWVYNIYTNVTKAIEESDFGSAGKAALQWLADGITGSIFLVLDAIGGVASGIWDAFCDFFGIHSPSTKFNDAGGFIIEGLINGLSGNTLVQKVKDTIANVASTIWSGFCEFFGIKSPSRLMMEGGRYIDEGLAIGLEDNANKVEDSAENVGDKTYDSLKAAMEQASDILSKDFDDTLTITPVLDLSEIQNGADSISSIMGSNNAFQYTADMASNIAAEKYNLEHNKDVVDEIELLRNDFRAMQNQANQPFTVTINIQSASGDPEEIAQEVSRILQQQVERNNQKWK